MPGNSDSNILCVLVDIQTLPFHCKIEVHVPSCSSLDYKTCQMYNMPSLMVCHMRQAQQSVCRCLILSENQSYKFLNAN